MVDLPRPFLTSIVRDEMTLFKGSKVVAHTVESLKLRVETLTDGLLMRVLSATKRRSQPTFRISTRAPQCRRFLTVMASSSGTSSTNSQGSGRASKGRGT